MNNEVIECEIKEVTPEIVDPDVNFNLEPSNSFPKKLGAFFDNPVPTFLYDPSFEDELRNFLAKQKELDNLRNECATRLYSQFSFPQSHLPDIYANSSFDVYYNGKYTQFQVFLYKYRGTYRAIRVDDFRTILILLSIPNAEWIKKLNSMEIFIDLVEYLHFNKIQHTINTYSSSQNTLTLESNNQI